MPLTDSQVRIIESRYSERRFRNEALLKQRKAQLQKSLPMLSEIDQEIAALTVEHVRLSLSASSENDTLAMTRDRNYKEKLASLSSKRIRLLNEAGFPTDYLDPIYDCKDCHDTGFIQGRKCHCYRRIASDLLYQRAGLSSILQEENFDRFSLDYYSPNFIDAETDQNARVAAEEALACAKRFLLDYRNPDADCMNLLLYGNTGVGKTFLSNCIAKEVLDLGDSVIYRSAAEFFAQLADERFSYSEESTLTDFLECDLLILDDLGTERNNTFVGEMLFSTIDGRLRRKKPTVISTNLNLAAIENRYSERIFSRLISYFTVRKMSGDDIRLKKKLKGETPLSIEGE